MALKSWLRDSKMRWNYQFHHQPHALPLDCPHAGAQWTPNVEVYDRDRPAYPQFFSEDEKRAQTEAGLELKRQVESAIASGAKFFDVPSGVYRLEEPITIERTEDFTLYAKGVELIVVADITHFRILSNKNLKVLGPLTLDAEPQSLSQGDIVALNEEDMTIDVRVWDGYEATTKTSGRIEIFNKEGRMLPHDQDPIQEVQDLGNGILRLTMNTGTWPQHSPTEAGEILKVGNFLAWETVGKGGLEMRCNRNTLWMDVEMCCHALSWALPEFGDDVFVRWKGSRRQGTNRLAGGGYPLMGFEGGAYILLDSEIGHNFDDITDINTPPTYAFHSLSTNSFLACETGDDFIQEGTELEIFNYETMELVAACRVVNVEDAADQEEAKAEFKQLAEKWNVRFLDSRILVLTIDEELRGLPEFSWVSLPGARCREMRFERNYIHDGLAAGINPKGANTVVIKDNIIERTGRFGIAVSVDPYWWEGNPSRNIEITSNTVRNCGYFDDKPGIAVYVDGPFYDRPGLEPFGQLQDGVQIAHNAIYTSAGPGISVIGAKNVEIHGNVMTDCSTCNRNLGSVYLNAVAEGTLVEGNMFVGWDASIENVQIKTGLRTRSHNIIVRGNLCANPEVGVPDLAWEFIPFADQAVEFHDAEWHVCEPDAHKESFEEGAMCTFRFEGSRVRWLGITAPWMGLSDVSIDNEFIATVDMSRWQGVVTDTRFISPLLREGHHCLNIRNKGEAGQFKSDERNGLSVSGFDVLGAGRCTE